MSVSVSAFAAASFVFVSRSILDRRNHAEKNSRRQYHCTSESFAVHSDLLFEFLRQHLSMISPFEFNDAARICFVYSRGNENRGEGSSRFPEEKGEHLLVIMQN
jgi:hypothetical protein